MSVVGELGQAEDGQGEAEQDGLDPGADLPGALGAAQGGGKEWAWLQAILQPVPPGAAQTQNRAQRS